MNSEARMSYLERKLELYHGEVEDLKKIMADLIKTLVEHEKRIEELEK